MKRLIACRKGNGMLERPYYNDRRKNRKNKAFRVMEDNLEQFDGNFFFLNYRLQSITVEEHLRGLQGQEEENNLKAYLEELFNGCIGFDCESQ